MANGVWTRCFDRIGKERRTVIAISIRKLSHVFTRTLDC